MQVFFPDLDEDEDWDTINSFPSPAQALRGCSECFEAVKGLLGIPYGKDLGNDYVRLRIVDAETKTLLLWDDESGALCGDLSAFAPPDSGLIGHGQKSH
jgi:hypothetical protein